jgi:hypothetical protein
VNLNPFFSKHNRKLNASNKLQQHKTIKLTEANALPTKPNTKNYLNNKAAARLGTFHQEEVSALA